MLGCRGTCLTTVSKFLAKFSKLSQHSNPAAASEARRLRTEVFIRSSSILPVLCYVPRVRLTIVMNIYFKENALNGCVW
jgi:hypothetical protein